MWKIVNKKMASNIDIIEKIKILINVFVLFLPWLLFSYKCGDLKYSSYNVYDIW